MKRTTPLLLMLLFGLTALWTSVQSYRMARREIADQLTEALLLTQAEMPADWLTTDTIRQFRSHICQVLWPGKPDASETLYTLVRRTKQALEREGRYAISSERGRSYRIDVL